MEKTAKEIIEMLKGHEEALGDDYITLMEDITDSIKQTEDMSKFIEKETFDKIKADYDTLKAKYIERFEKGELEPPPLPEQKKEDPAEKITIDDLFKKES